MFYVPRYGMEAVIDWDKVFPDHELSIADKGIQALNFGNTSDSIVI